MKRLLTAILAIAILISPMYAENDLDDKLKLFTEIDMYLGLKTGIRYELNDRLDIINTFGVSFTSAYQNCYSLYVAYHTMAPYSTVSVDVNMGIIQGVFDLTSWDSDHYFYINPGAAMHVSYPILNHVRIGAMGGMMFTIGYDQGQWWTGIEPYAGVTISYSKK